jgi:hypothetical protein
MTIDRLAQVGAARNRLDLGAHQPRLRGNNLPCWLPLSGILVNSWQENGSSRNTGEGLMALTICSADASKSGGVGALRRLGPCPTAKRRACDRQWGERRLRPCAGRRSASALTLPTPPLTCPLLASPQIREEPKKRHPRLRMPSESQLVRRIRRLA